MKVCGLPSQMGWKNANSPWLPSWLTYRNASNSSAPVGQVTRHLYDNRLPALDQPGRWGDLDGEGFLGRGPRREQQGPRPIRTARMRSGLAMAPPLLILWSFIYGRRCCKCRVRLIRTANALGRLVSQVYRFPSWVTALGRTNLHAGLAGERFSRSGTVRNPSYFRTL
jgi:hypothetical protein